MYGLEINKELLLSHGKQLENQIRDAILSGRLAAGEKMPPSRKLSAELSVARNTIIQVYEQLIAEGYLNSIGGSGTYVAKIGTLPSPKKTEACAKIDKAPKRKDIICFDAGNPDGAAFPKIHWAKALKTACLEAGEEAFHYGLAGGHSKLQKAICSYVYRVKGIQCNYNQIIIVPGTAGGMNILAQTFYKNGIRIAIEDPCMNFVVQAFATHGYHINPIEVDMHGMQIEKLKSNERVDLIYIVPSHQFPMGAVLPAARRISLLQYACDHDAYIIEDDYDSEFRYKGELIQSLRNLNPDRVIYMGSFSKIFTPSIRMGYMILPEELCDRVIHTMKLSNTMVNTIEQLAMADYINSMQLDKHVYKMKKLYENKRKHLMECLHKYFGDSISITGENAGLHLLLGFQRAIEESDYKEFEKNGVDVECMEDFSIQKGRNCNQLVLGYGALNFAQIEEGVRRLKISLF